MALITDREIVAFFSALYGTGKGQQAANPLFLNLCEGIKPVHDVSRRADLKVGRQFWVMIGANNSHSFPPITLESGRIYFAQMLTYLNETTPADRWDPTTEDCWIMDATGIADVVDPAQLDLAHVTLTYDPGLVGATGGNALGATDGVAYSVLMHTLRVWDAVGVSTPGLGTGGALMARNHHQSRTRFPLRMDGSGASVLVRSRVQGPGPGGGVNVIVYIRLWIGPKNHLPPGL